MNIQGIQKVTLLDYPKEVACTIFLGGCNLRCVYCHNREICDCKNVPIPKEEILSYLDLRKNVLTGVVISGGEPMLGPSNDFDELLELAHFMEDIKKLGYKIKLDTNGTCSRALLSIILRNLLDYVAVDIKGPMEYYPIITGAEPDTDRVAANIELLDLYHIDHELRTTVVKEYFNESSAEAIAQWLKKLSFKPERYYLQKFVMSPNVPDKTLTSPTDEELEKYADIIRPYVKFVGIR